MAVTGRMRICWKQWQKQSRGNMEAIVVHLTDDSIKYRKFETVEEAEEYAASLNFKAYLIIGDNLDIEDFT